MNRYSRPGLVVCILSISMAPLLLAGQSRPEDKLPLKPPGSSVAVTDDAFSLMVNPAGLAVHPGFEGTFMYYQEMNNSYSFGQSLVLKAYGMALGLDYLKPEAGAATDGMLRYSIGWAPLSYRDIFFAGASLQVYDSLDSGRGLGVGWSAGLLVRPWRYLSLGLAGRNLGNVGVTGLGRLDGKLDIGIAVRPGIDMVTISSDVSLFDDNRSRFPIDFRIDVEPVSGLKLVATADLDANLSAGIILDMAHIDLGFYTWFSPDSFSAASVHISATADARPALATLGAGWLRIDVDQGLAAGAQADGIPLISKKPRTVLSEVMKIERAAHDPRVNGILLVVDSNHLGPADMQELSQAVSKFEKSGKHVVAYLSQPSTLSYLLAVSADKVVVPPGAVLSILGTKLSTYYLKDTLERLGVEVEAEKARGNVFKSAPDSFTKTGPSDPAREAYSSLVQDMYTQLVSKIAGARGLSAQRVKELIDRGLLDCNEAQKNGLVDKVAYIDGIKEVINGFFPGQRIVLIRSLAAREKTSWGPNRRIGIIDLKGTIVTGKGGKGLLGNEKIGSATASAAIERAARDNSLEALVVRIDSPGGSVFASDQIWRRMKNAGKKKPLVISMGNMAASGGYYLSCGGDTIVAEPWSITGSIGVFALRLDASGLLSKLGIKTATFKQGKRADMWSLSRPATKSERETIRSIVTGFYDRFLNTVAMSRHMDVKQVEKIAKGRAWTGRKARDLGLVDQLGGLAEAIDIAKAKAGIPMDEDVDLVVVPHQPLSLVRALLQTTLNTAMNAAAKTGVSGEGQGIDYGKEIAGKAVSFLGIPPQLMQLLLDVEGRKPLALSSIWLNLDSVP
ncbi:MAG: signal peptide peptidase SppA [Deltaproteobacteria bacterium]|nr:signal peptide peptidase SppA [Deltaproteobacteria bacterium]